jgi:autotransporter-associated beta strand protein
MKTTPLIIVSLLLVPHAYGQSATWNLNPMTNDWNTAANWTPPNVPDQPGESANFGPSMITGVNLTQSATIDNLVFAADANPYTITLQPATVLALDLAGVINKSGLCQSFFVESAADGIGGLLNINNEASSGTQITFMNLGNSTQVFAFGGQTSLNDTTSAEANIFINQAGTAAGSFGGVTALTGSASAANGIFTSQGGAVGGAYGGFTTLNETASAGSAIFINEAGTVAGAIGGTTSFNDTSVGDTATITSLGATTEGALGGTTAFTEKSTAMNDVLIAEGGSNGGGGGRITFSTNANGGSARVILRGNGTLDMTLGLRKLVNIGSLEGDGIVILRLSLPFDLVVGSNNQSTTFNGTIQGMGSLNKLGTGTLTLTNASTYTGGITAVGDGVLIVNNLTGSATGTGAVAVNGGTLGGGGIISGPVTVGTGSGSGAFLAPSFGRNKQVTLTLQSSLTLQAEATYTYTFAAKNRQVRTDQVKAVEVTINGAAIAIAGSIQGQLKVGKVLTLISNTGAHFINGAFNNLADGAIVNVNGNNFQASYSGGDGNDLTLTVLP